MNTDNLARFIALSSRKVDLERELRDVKEKLAGLEPGLLEQFAQEGVQSIRQNGRLAYLYGQLWARPLDGDKGRAVAALRAAGLGSLVEESFNVSTLSAWCRERETAGEPLPTVFEGAIMTERSYSLRVKG